MVLLLAVSLTYFLLKYCLDHFDPQGVTFLLYIDLSIFSGWQAGRFLSWLLSCGAIYHWH